ncbi:MAG TPA: hypothetical protein VHM29_10755 [Acidimicrobiia bacterium]|jgi:hypothetical protein|nr:hypothetical protein [Acidimicrobiia bacterium]
MTLISNQAELVAFLERGELDIDAALEVMQNVRSSNAKERFIDKVVRLMQNHTTIDGGPPSLTTLDEQLSPMLDVEAWCHEVP